MEERLKTEQENILKKLIRIELEYFRSWLMNHYDIFALEHNIAAYIDIIEEVDAKHKDIINFLKKIHDHSEWEIDEKEFIEEDNYPTWDEALIILKKVESWEMNIDELLSDYYEICKNTVQEYEKKFKIELPLEVQKIVSFKKGYLVFDGREYYMDTPEEWLSLFEFYALFLNA